MKLTINQILQPFAPLYFRRGAGAFAPHTFKIGNVLKMLVLFATTATLASCKKNTIANNNTTDNLFTENINNIQRLEPVMLHFTNNTTTAINWQITPNSNTQIEKAGDYATLKFAVEGIYTAIAKVGNKQATYIISVNNNMYNGIGNTFGITASKIVGINYNEEVLFTVNNAANSNIVWTTNGVLPFIQLAADTKSAIYSFKGGSSATVTVSDGVHTQSRTIFLNDISSSISIDTVPFIFGDKLNITPSLSNDKKTLYFLASTTYKYQCNTDKILSVNDTANNSINISYGGMAMSSTLCSTITPATCINSCSNIANGVYQFNINYENKTFTGTLTVSNNKYTIGFVNNSLINFTSLQVE